ncbi:hypothetical protein EUGRSUZ_J00955 [Eucalyptus grandis]|uniref:AB hydrolase-1 domain-containing protein n=2 Tax=Eucalyptus grandis TaxID=71139 RepID=A0A059ACT7_EUCGR|nr:hypothetical protein EUGRSUZ_J00955 [Eucalyptus grandis]
MSSAAGAFRDGSAGGVGGTMDHAREFARGAAEMCVELARGCRDIVRQTLGNENSFLARYFGRGSYVAGRLRGPCGRAFARVKRLNEYLPEDKDPTHVWSVVLFVSLFAVAALSVYIKPKASVPLAKKVFLHPPSASRILLPDGRYIAYKEYGIPPDEARFTIIFPHPFLSSRLAGVPGLKSSLLEEFGIRLITYDLPGFGESDPHPHRNLESSAWDISLLANALGVNDKFWVLGYSSGSMHAWASLRYIPGRVAGAAMFAPMVNPYDPLMTREERYRTWNQWTRRRKFLFFLARRLPRFLSFFYHRSFLSGRHGQIDKWLSLSLENRDRALIEDPFYEEFWQRDVEESIRQGHAKPFVEEAALQVSDWGFSLADLKLQKKRRGKGVLNWLKWLISLLSEKEPEYTGYLGPIHMWQGMDDKVVPPAMTDFVHRVLPGAAVHKLPYQGHFTYLYFCDECHRQIFTTLFGTPQGPLTNNPEADLTQRDEKMAEQEDILLVDVATE